MTQNNHVGFDSTVDAVLPGSPRVVNETSHLGVTVPNNNPARSSDNRADSSILGETVAEKFKTRIKIDDDNLKNVCRKSSKWYQIS